MTSDSLARILSDEVGAVAASGFLRYPIAANPNPVTAGHIAADNDDHALVGTDGSVDFWLAQNTRFFALTIDEPDVLGNDSVIILPVPASQYPGGITLVELGLTSRDDATDSVWLAEWTDPEADVGTESQIDTLTQAGATEVSSTSFNDAAIASGTYVVAIFKLASGKPVTIWGRFRVNTND
jgi:hypothetical protein